MYPTDKGQPYSTGGLLQEGKVLSKVLGTFSRLSGLQGRQAKQKMVQWRALLIQTSQDPFLEQYCVGITPEERASIVDRCVRVADPSRDNVFHGWLMQQYARGEFTISHIPGVREYLTDFYLNLDYLIHARNMEFNYGALTLSEVRKIVLNLPEHVRDQTEWQYTDHGRYNPRAVGHPLPYVNEDYDKLCERRWGRPHKGVYQDAFVRYIYQKHVFATAYFRNAVEAATMFGLLEPGQHDEQSLIDYIQADHQVILPPSERTDGSKNDFELHELNIVRINKADFGLDGDLIDRSAGVVLALPSPEGVAPSSDADEVLITPIVADPSPAASKESGQPIISAAPDVAAEVVTHTGFRQPATEDEVAISPLTATLDNLTDEEARLMESSKAENWPDAVSVADFNPDAENSDAQTLTDEDITALFASDDTVEVSVTPDKAPEQVPEQAAMSAEDTSLLAIVKADKVAMAAFEGMDDQEVLRSFKTCIALIDAHEGGAYTEWLLSEYRRGIFTLRDAEIIRGILLVVRKIETDRREEPGRMLRGKLIEDVCEVIDVKYNFDFTKATGAMLTLVNSWTLPEARLRSGPVSEMLDYLTHMSNQVDQQDPVLA